MASALQKYREKAGLTQRELADKVEVDPITVSRWERGRSYPDVNTALKLAVVLKATPRELFPPKAVTG